MTAKRDWTNRTTTFECEMCGDTFEAEGVRIDEAYEEYKDHGGVARMIDGEWAHFCEDCA